MKGNKENSEIIEIHYNAFQTISEQLTDYVIKDKKILKYHDKFKDYIFILFVNGFLTEKELNKACNRLQKEIVKNIKGKRKNKGV